MKINVEVAKQTKTRAKPKPKSKQKQLQDTDTKLCKAGLKELAYINNQFYTLLNRIDKLPNIKDKLTKELPKLKKTHIKVNDEIVNLKDRNYIVIEIM